MEDNIMNRIPEELKREMGLLDDTIVSDNKVISSAGIEMKMTGVESTPKTTGVDVSPTLNPPSTTPNYVYNPPTVQTSTPVVEETKEEKVEENTTESGISETFDNLLKGVVKPQVILPEERNSYKKVVDNNPLDKIVVDLNTIEIVEKSPLEQINDFNTVFKNTSVYQIVAVQSGYSGEMSALTMKDINSINNSNVDLYNHKKKLYAAIHDHLENTSVGKLGFTDWLKITSYHDIETFLYGIYCQTFPEKNEFDVTCGSCKKNTNLIVNNETLVETRNQGLVMMKIDEIISNIHKAEELVGRSLVHTSSRIMLPESKIIVNIHTPSLWDHLEMLRTLDQNLLNNYATTLGLMLFTKNVYMMDVARTLSTNKPSYYELKDKAKILDTFTKLSIKDGKYLEDSINERSEKYEISYSVKNAKCMHCGDSLGNIPISMENALFTLIGRILE